MRTRILPRMLNDEVEEYLSRNDIIIVPVGTVEMHGGFPLDSETTITGDGRGVGRAGIDRTSVFLRRRNGKRQGNRPGECAGRNRLFDGGGKQPVAPGIQTPDLHQFSRPGTYDMQSDGAGFL